MDYLIGLILALSVAGLAAIIGFDRERVFYPTLLIVIGSYYALFAVMAASMRALVIESVVAGGFLLLAVVAFKRNLWFVVAAIIGHGVFDFTHHMFIKNPGVPQWWPGFCLAFDVTLGALLSMRLIRGRLLPGH
jgi:hypothetical protein